MTVNEKRQALQAHCDKGSCRRCKLHGREKCSCGYGHMFDRDPTDDAYMTDAEIIGAYEIVFGSTATEEFTCELQTVDDNSITIFGVDKIQNITINFKEDKNDGN